MRYSGTTEKTRSEMLAAIGVSCFEDLLTSIPDDVRVAREIDVAGPWPESDLVATLEEMKGKRPRVSLLGAGLYQHYIPRPVDSLCARSEWVTVYTPYQPENAQGVLTMYYEFQSYVAMLTGQEIANGGMYDGSTALAEAVLMALRLRPKADPVVYVSSLVHPQYRAVLKTYMRFVGVEVVEMPHDGETGRTRCEVSVGDQQKAVAVVLQSPNFFGVIEDFDGVDAEAFTIGVCTEALALAMLEPLDVDIAVGDVQSFGIPMQLGGPTAGFFATSKKHVRKLPGRLVGRTKDTNGDDAFCITLATREQFIRREKATSNICTASGLMCLRATVYLSLMGREGLQELAGKNASTIRFLAAGLEKAGLRVAFSGPTFNEVVIDASSKPGLYEKLLERDIVFGLPLGEHYEGLEHHYLINATEVHYRNAEAILQELEDVARDS